jgi:hypothetical protein
MDDVLEILGYAAGFWLFIFSVRFRKTVSVLLGHLCEDLQIS